MEILFGVILVLSFFGLVYYCVKGHNLMIGFFLMTCIWTLIALIGHWSHILPDGDTIDSKFKDVSEFDKVVKTLANIFQEGPASYAASTLVNVFFGAFFGRVLMETGIASTLIRKVVELGGDKPRIIMFFLSVLCAVLFTTLTGVGPAISIGVIIIPILLTLGVPTSLTLFLFIGSIMAGIFANITNVTQYIGIFSGTKDWYSYLDWAPFGWTFFGVALLVVTLVSNIGYTFSKRGHSWAAKNVGETKVKMKKCQPILVQPEDTKSTILSAPWYSWIAIALPVCLVVFLKLSILLSFVISSIYALACCKALKGGFKGICRTFSKLFADGCYDVVPMIGFLLCLAMFNNAAGYVAPYFKSILSWIPSTPFALCIIFAVAAPLGYFRGPLNLVGCGAAFLGVLKALNPDFFLVPDTAPAAGSLEFLKFQYGFSLFNIVTIATMHVDITLSWVAWGLGYTKIPSKDFMKYSIPTGWITAASCVVISYFWSMGLGAF